VTEKADLAGAEDWICGRCNRPLVIKRVSVSYMNSSFPVDLPVCPGCGQVFVTEALATGKMAEVEQALEDK
jgi:hypothetical protein